MHEPLAAISDIHGNVRALGAVLDEIKRRGIRRIVNLGDSLYGPFDPRPAAERLMGLDIQTVSGNEDRILLEPDAGSRAARFTRERLESAQLAWLGKLPATAVVDDVFLCHGTPSDDTAYLLSTVTEGHLAERPLGEIERLVASARERVILCGHDHTPRRVVGGGKLFVNPGSVGCPAYSDDAPEAHVVELGSPDARFAILAPAHGGDVAVEWVVLPYDSGAAAAEARSNGFPDWAHWLAFGRVG